MATGSRARISSSFIVQGWISQYTDISRMRRAMSIVYCDPKSRMRTWGRRMAGAS